MPAMRFQPGCPCCENADCCLPATGDLELVLPDQTVPMSFFVDEWQATSEHPGTERFTKPNTGTTTPEQCSSVGFGTIFLNWFFRCNSETDEWFMSATAFVCVCLDGSRKPGCGTTLTVYSLFQPVAPGDCQDDFFLPLDVPFLSDVYEGQNWPYDPEVGLIIQRPAGPTPG